MATGETVTKTITISNTGRYDLQYDLPAGWNGAIYIMEGENYVDCGANMLHDYTNWTIEALIKPRRVGSIERAYFVGQDE
ncbi:hypothetical protein JXA70_21385 [candidate division KSB1 bacterium]|nr:hypothetical protein [candidate division KSB1 bacterium]